MKIQIEPLRPYGIELLGLAVLDLLILIAGNTARLLNYYSLSGSSKVVAQGTGVTIKHGLAYLDNFHATNSVVTFAFWGMVGLFCYSVITGVMRIIRDYEDMREVASNEYIHPPAFRRQAFWHRVVTDVAQVVVLSVLSIAVLFLVFSLCTPIAISYCQAALSGGLVSRASDFVIGFVVLFAGLLVADICLRLLLNRHRIFSRTDIQHL